jgi:gas vesicle structural protein
MTTVATTRSRSQGAGYVQRSSSTGLYDVLDLILDKGLVIDIFLRVSLVGIELLTVDARIVIASVDTYLHFAEAVNRLDLSQQGAPGLPELLEDVTEHSARNKTKGILEGAKEALFGSEEDDESGDEESGGSRRPAQTSRSRPRVPTRGRQN